MSYENPWAKNIIKDDKQLLEKELPKEQLSEEELDAKITPKIKEWEEKTKEYYRGKKTDSDK